MIYQNAEIYNVEELIEDKEHGGLRLLRLPQTVVEKLNANAQNSVYYSCGCEIRFNLHSEEAIIYLRRDFGSRDIMPYGVAEIWQGDHQGRYQLSPQPVGQEKTAIRIRKMGVQEMESFSYHHRELFDPKLYRVFVPYDWGTSIYGIEGDISLPKKEQVPERTLLSYGSSITHGGGITVPTAGYAFRLARKLGMDLRNLGLAGSAWMDDAIADYICEQEWDIATLELGINVVHWPIEEFEEKTREFVTKIGKAHPDKPIYCISPFTSVEDFRRKDHMVLMRQTVQKIVNDLNLKSLKYIDGEVCLTDLSGLSSDGIHPSNSGMEEIAEKLYQAIR